MASRRGQAFAAPTPAEEMQPAGKLQKQVDGLRHGAAAGAQAARDGAREAVAQREWRRRGAGRVVVLVFVDRRDSASDKALARRGVEKPGRSQTATCAFEGDGLFLAGRRCCSS